MFGLSLKLIRALFIIVGIGCFFGFVEGGVLGLVLFGSETLIQGITAFLAYAPLGGIIGTFLTGLAVLYVTYCAAMNSKESANESE